jgi:hypothetical protein
LDGSAAQFRHRRLTLPAAASAHPPEQGLNLSSKVACDKCVDVGAGANARAR